MTKDIKILMRHLGDGTWVIYDIPDMEDLYTITRKQAVKQLSTYLVN